MSDTGPNGDRALPTQVGLPDGTVTFVLTDVVGSTELWEKTPRQMREAMVAHDELVASVVEANSGMLVRPRGEGDSRFAVFRRASEAVAAAARVVEVLENSVWSTPVPIQVRVGIHTGEADLRDGDYYGTSVNLCARIRGLAEPNQVFVSEATSRMLMRSDSEVRLHEVGAYELKGLSIPERVFRLELRTDDSVIESTDRFKPANLEAASRLIPTNNLPIQTTSFVGRERELGEVTELLTESRLVTLVGTGGAGKTRLAIQATSDLLDGSGDGVWLVELASIEDQDLVDVTVLKAVGLRENPEECALETMLGALRTRRLLIVLDNCEHVIDACAKLAEALLRSCSEVHILATSREPLGIRAESVYRVPSLSMPPDDESVSAETAGRFGAVKLFIERAHNNDQSLHLDEDTTPAVVSICRQVDGIPLAIELAAARLRTMSVHTIEERLGDRLRLLTGGSRTNLPRQQTLRAMIDWSYDLLTEPERTVLRRLSVFSDGFEAEVAEVVCARGDLEAFDLFDIIASLVDKSLVQRDPSGASTRYRLLETVRQYASELLGTNTDDTRATRDAHADAYLAVAEQAASHLEDSQQFEWLARLDAEHENLRAAFGHFHADDHHGIDALRICAALEQYWLTRGEYREGIEMLEAALDHKDAKSPTSPRASALLAFLPLQANWGDRPKVAARTEEAIVLTSTLGHPGLAYALSYRALNQFREGDITNALVTVDEAVGVAERSASATYLPRALISRGMVYNLADQAERGLADLAESVRIYTAAGNKIRMTSALNSLSYSELEVDLDDAERHARDAYRMAVEWNLEGDVPYCAATLATVNLLRGHPETAETLATAALEVCRRTGDKVAGAAAVLLLALSASQMGLSARAARLHGASDACSIGQPFGAPDDRLRVEDHDRLRHQLGERFDVLYVEGTRLSSLEEVRSFLRTESPA